VFQNLANYLVQVSPTNASNTFVTGSATLGGTLVANSVGGPYTLNQIFPVVSVVGPLTGTFSGLATTGDFGTATLSLAYGPHEAFLIITVSGAAAPVWKSVPGTSDWNTGTNWVSGLVPTPTDIALFNASIERVAYKPLRSAPRLAPLITAVGVSFIVQNIGLALYGVNYQTVPNFIPRTNVFHLGGITYSWSKASVLIIVIPLLILLSWFVRSTKQGKAMRAVAQDTEASAMMGIDVNRTISVTFLLAGSLAGAAGIVYLLQFNMRYDTGFELGLIAFTAAVLGGIGNLTGAVLGALIIGFIQAFNEGLGWHAAGSDWTRTMVFGILILILVFRPEGILGEQTPEGA